MLPRKRTTIPKQLNEKNRGVLGKKYKLGARVETKKPEGIT